MQTRYARLSEVAAWAVILASLASFGYLWIASERSAGSYVGESIAANLYDANLYRAVASRVRGGEGYYDAAASELRLRGYPTDSVFYWRLPTYSWIFGNPFGPACAHVLLMILISLAATLTYAEVPTPGAWPGRAAGAFAIAASYGWIAHPYPAYHMELLSGILVFISACCAGAGRWSWGVAAALAALVVRELALPYVFVLVGLASWYRRRGTAAWLLIGLAVFLFLFRVHAYLVADRTTLAASGNYLHWVSYGGIPFLMAVVRMNFLIASLPMWCTSLYTTLALLGLMGWEGRPAAAHRLTVLTYLTLFAFVGRESNCYWGWMIMPCLLVGFLVSPVALRDLVAAASGSSGPRDARSAA